MLNENINFSILISSYLSVFANLYMILFLLGYRNITKNYKLYLSVLMIGTYVFISYILTENFFRTILWFLLTIMGVFYMTRREKISKSKVVIVCFICWMYILLLDVLTFLIGTLLVNFDVESSKGIMFKNMIVNMIIIILFVLTFSNKNVKKACNNISNWTFDKKSKYMIGIVLLSVLLFSVMFYLCYFNMNRFLMLVIILISVIVYTIVVFGIIREYERNVKIQSEYDVLLKNLNEYENLLDIQRVSNHENKNQLLVIKGMIDKNEEKVNEYIDSIIDNQYKDNDVIIYKTNKIPSGGLRGLIYYKILTMRENKIESNLDVDRSLSDLDFNDIPVKTNQELCKIVGVFLDNAIQAVNDLKKKKIDIYLKYENRELYVKVSNNYKGIIELDRIDNSGYTTKGKGHGYGLSLVKNIVKNNDNFQNVREIRGKMFSQIIKLKIE